MNIKTEAKINIIFGKYINYMPFGFKFIACLALFRAINLIAFDSLGFSFPVTYISTLTKLFVLISVLFFIPVIIYSIFKKFFSKIKLALSEPNMQPFMLEHQSSFEQLDDVLGHLVKEQIKQKTVVTNK